MKTDTVMLPLPPSANSIWRRAGTRIHISPAYAAWKNEAGVELLRQRMQRVTGTYEMTIHVPLKMRGDVDNRNKALSDLMVQHGIVEDDRFCHRLTICRCAAIPPKFCKVKITTFNEEEE